MDPTAPISSQAGINTTQYLMLLALALSMLVAALAGLVHHQAKWFKLSWLSDLLFSKSPQQKVLGKRFMVGASNCIAGIAALNYGVTQGVIDPDGCRWLSITGLAATTAFYLTFRTGWNQRLADPAMIEPQTWMAIGFMAWGYLIGGPGQAVALLLLFVILMFSMFTSTSRQLVRASCLAAVLFGAAMWRTADVQRHIPNGPQLQLVYFCVLLLVLISVCVMVFQLNHLRAEATQHKLELQDALARIQDLATRDELTGLFNRRHMLELLNIEKHRSNRTGRVFCLGMVDIDHFKQVNDRFGHNVGDQVLDTVAATISAGLRETDVVARWGGEEFLVMFTDTDCQTAERVLARIQVALAKTMVSDDAPGLRVTFSAGVTAYIADEMLTSTIDRADRALYAAKAAGRNLVQREAA
jgi:diguanylate cyclase (GGDEF)-like protein